MRTPEEIRDLLQARDLKSIKIWKAQSQEGPPETHAAGYDTQDVAIGFDEYVALQDRGAMETIGR